MKKGVVNLSIFQKSGDFRNLSIRFLGSNNIRKEYDYVTYDAPIDPKEEPTGPQDTRLMHLLHDYGSMGSFRSKDRPLLAFEQKLELLSSNNSTASTDLLSSPMFR